MARSARMGVDTDAARRFSLLANKGVFEGFVGDGGGGAVAAHDHRVGVEGVEAVADRALGELRVAPGEGGAAGRAVEERIAGGQERLAVERETEAARGVAG